MVVLTFFLASAAAAEPVSRGWPTYGGSYANTRHFKGTQIGPHNVASLKLAWKFATGEYGSCSTSPIVVGGVLYATTAPTNTVFALDAATGALRWRYTPVVGPAHYVAQANRGVAVDGGRVFFATLDAQLIALDAATGKPRWTVRIGDPASGLSETMAPLAWNGLVFIGSSGGDFGIRGSFSAYSQADGRLVWRWYSVSPGWEGRFVASVDGIPLHRDLARERALAVRYRDAWRHGGGPVWGTPALSPAEGAIYLSTGNPSPEHNGEARPGDNLYTDSIVALDARTGRMRWFYQEVPHDLWDYDAASPPVLFDVVTPSGRRIPAVGEAGKIGFLYIVDRRSGRLIRRSRAFVPQHNLFTPPSAAGELIEPGIAGGAIAPVAYDPALHSVFVGASALPERLQSEPFKPWPGGNQEWSLGTAVWPENGAAFFSRIDVDTGRIVWQYRVSAPSSGGTLSVPGVVFATETVAGRLDAFDARTGKLLWQVVPTQMETHRSLASIAGNLVWRVVDVAASVWHHVRRRVCVGSCSSDAAIHAPPVAYEMRGKEYIAVAVDRTWAKSGPKTGSTIYAFTI